MCRSIFAWCIFGRYPLSVVCARCFISSQFIILSWCHCFMYHFPSQYVMSVTLAWCFMFTSVIYCRWYVYGSCNINCERWSISVINKEFLETEPFRLHHRHLDITTVASTELQRSMSKICTWINTWLLLFACLCNDENL